MSAGPRYRDDFPCRISAATVDAGTGVFTALPHAD